MIESKTVSKSNVEPLVNVCPEQSIIYYLLGIRQETHVISNSVLS